MKMDSWLVNLDGVPFAGKLQTTIAKLIDYLFVLLNANKNFKMNFV
jgi:hypothetical protein